MRRSFRSPRVRPMADGVLNASERFRAPAAPRARPKWSGSGPRKGWTRKHERGFISADWDGSGDWFTVIDHGGPEDAVLVSLTFSEIRWLADLVHTALAPAKAGRNRTYHLPVCDRHELHLSFTRGFGMPRHWRGKVQCVKTNCTRQATRWLIVEVMEAVLGR